MKNQESKTLSRKLILTAFAGFVALGSWLVPTLGLAAKSKVSLPLESSNAGNFEKYCENKKCPAKFQETWVAAEKGNPSAQNRIGVMFHFGQGIPQNYAEALKWYLRASEGKHAEAANHIGRIYLNGEGVAKDAVEACKWYEKSGEWGHSWGMMNAASCYKYGHGGFGQNEAKSNEWYQRAEKAQPGILKQYERDVEKLTKQKKDSTAIKTFEFE